MLKKFIGKFKNSPKFPLLVSIVLSIFGVLFVVFALFVLFSDVLDTPSNSEIIIPTPIVSPIITVTPTTINKSFEPDCIEPILLNSKKQYYLCVESTSSDSTCDEDEGIPIANYSISMHSQGNEPFEFVSELNDQCRQIEYKILGNEILSENWEEVLRAGRFVLLGESINNNPQGKVLLYDFEANKTTEFPERFIDKQIQYSTKFDDRYVFSKVTNTGVLIFSYDQTLLIINLVEEILIDLTENQSIDNVKIDFQESDQLSVSYEVYVLTEDGPELVRKVNEIIRL